MANGDKIKDFRERVKALEPDKEAVKAQHAKGKLTAQERLDLLLDKGSFVELDAFAELQSANYDLPAKKKPRDGVISGYGTIGKRPVYAYAQDFTFMGGSMGEMHNRKIARIMELALKNGAPCIGLFDSGGARIQEGVQALDGGGEIFKLNTMMSLRGNRRLLSCAHRFHLHDQEEQLHVHHRPRCHQGGDRRADRFRRAWGSSCALLKVRSRTFCRR